MPEHAKPADPISRSTFNPFPGLRAFEPDEDYLYFGRERQIDELLHRLGETRLLAVVGTSGSGKSSLVRAGLVPSLYSGFMTRAGSSWRVAILRPGGDPIGNLAAALDNPAVLGQGEELGVGEASRMIIESTLRASSVGLADCVRQSQIPVVDNVLVVVDQFEELFRFKHSAHASRDEAVAFVKLLLEAAASDLPVYIVLTMRSEFIGDCMEFPGLPEAINRGQYLVPRMTRDELRLAITGPVGVRGAQISPRLVARLLNDLEDDQDQLPVLQHALMRMWGYWESTRGEGATLDLDHYEAIGTLSEALSRHAESTFEGLTGARDREIAERLFKALTDIDREGRAVRRLVQVQEICALTGASEAVVVGAIERFRLPGRSFLMPPPTVALDGDSVVDLSHESLMRNWVRFKSWAREEAESAAVYRRLSQAAALAQTGEGSLWRSPELDIGLHWRETERPTAAWAQRYNPAFAQAMAFLDRSQGRRRQLRLARLLALSLTMFALAAVPFTFFYVRGRITEQQTRLRTVLLASDPLVRVLLLAELEDAAGLGRDRGVEVAQEVTSAAIPKAVLRGQDEALVGVAFRADDAQVATVSAQGTLDWWRSDGRGDPRRGVPIRPSPSGDPPPELTVVAFSGDGRSLAAGFADGTLLFRSSDADKSRKSRSAAIRSLAFSPDGRRIVVGYDDYQVEIWSLEDGGITILGTTDEERHKAPVSGVAFAADERVVTASWDATARIWDLRTGGPPTVLRGAKGSEAFQSAGFSPDGKWVICASSDGSVLIWSRDGSGGPIELAGHGETATHASFAPNGLKVVATFADHTAQVWALRLNAERLEPAGAPMVLGGHTGPVTAAVFSHSGNEIATISDDGTARIWPSEPGEPRILGRHSKGVESVAFSPDATRVVSASRDRSTRVWTLVGSKKPVVLDGHLDWARTAAFSPAGTQVLTASEDGTYRLWDLARGAMRVFPESAPVAGAAFDPAGARVVTATKDNTARIWTLDAAGGATLEVELAGPKGHTDWIWSAAFSADGTRVVTASRDRTARVWSLPWAGDAPAVLEGHRDQLRKAAFSPDGRRVVTASADGTARVWTLDGTAKPIVLRHDDKVNDAAFSASGRWVVTASEDGTARVWSADTGVALMVLRHASPVRSAAFSPRPAGGREEPAYVATGCEDGTVRIWRLSLPALIDYARTATTACLTADQRVHLLHESEVEANRRAAECEKRFDRKPPAE